MNERVVKIGKPTPLLCITSEPQKIDSDQPALIILNSGIMHHIGTCRLSVKIARAAANAGILAIRMDFSGIGDSEHRTGAMNFTESAPKEVKEVMDFFEKTRGIKKFILYGLCSGADASYETAKIDTRVVAMCQIDSYCYRDWRYYVRYYGPRIIDAKVWKKHITKFFKRNTNKVDLQEFEEFIELPSYVREFPPKKEIETGLKSLLERDVYMYNIFTDGVDECLNSANQYRRNFRKLKFGDKLKVDYYEDSSHIVSEPKYQKIFVEDIIEWALHVIARRGSA